MAKENSPPPAKTGSPPCGNDLSALLDNDMSNEDKAASDNIGKFLAAIPSASRSQFLAAISSKEFLKFFTAIASDDSETPQVKFKYENDDYAAFVAKQAETSREEYEHYKSQYNAINHFGNAKVPFQAFASGFQVTAAPCLGDQSLTKVVLCKDDCGDTPLARQKTREKIVREIKPEIQTFKISRILTSNNESSYDVATNALSTQTILQGINRYITQYDFTSIIMIPQGMSSAFTPACINSSTKWLHAIDDFDRIEDHQYSAWQEFILRNGTAVEIESDDWLEGTLLLSMEVTLCAEVESDLKGLPANHRGAITMLCFIIKHLVVRNQEAWDALEEYVKTFDIHNFPGEMSLPLASSSRLSSMFLEMMILA
jgi:hypothetical protein